MPCAPNETFKYSWCWFVVMRKIAQDEQNEVPDNTVFWATVGIISVFVIVIATVMIVRYGATGQVVLQYPQPSRPFEANPYACLDVPPCGSEVSFMCCAEERLPGSSMKCTAPLDGYAGGTQGYPQAYGAPGAHNLICPDHMPYRCTCPEKFQYRQSWPVPSR